MVVANWPIRARVLLLLCYNSGYNDNNADGEDNDDDDDNDGNDSDDN